MGKDVSRFESTPFQQFHLLDWTVVREDHLGSLIDEESQIPAHMCEMGAVVSLQRTPYPITQDQIKAKVSDLVITNYLIEQDYHERRLAMEFEKAYILKELDAAKRFDWRLILAFKRLTRKNY